MAHITFSGDPRAPGTDPAGLVMHGISFPFGQAVEVADAAIVAKLRSHSHFTVEGEAAEPTEAPAKPSKADNLAKARAAKAAKAEKIDA